MHQALLKVLRKHYCQIEFTFSHQLLHFVHRLNAPPIIKVGVLLYALRDAGSEGIGRGVIKSHTNILHLHIDGKAEQQDLHYRHSKDDQQRPIVAHDVAELFFYKC
ncbi:hypothetical protein SDC9_181658 [bioreactor metagenome]|uniref:Uncharacterized protein n=1 Tax=bioreactor metagenome TaxID=1076179 RepID=A0A645H587_9ZZZZ